MNAMPDSVNWQLVGFWCFNGVVDGKAGYSLSIHKTEASSLIAYGFPSIAALIAGSVTFFFSKCQSSNRGGFVYANCCDVKDLRVNSCKSCCSAYAYLDHNFAKLR